MISWIFVILLLACQSLADLTCTKYQPPHFSSNAGKVVFTVQNPNFDLPPDYDGLIIANPSYIDYKNRNGTYVIPAMVADASLPATPGYRYLSYSLMISYRTFKFDSCTSKSFGFKPYTINGSCHDYGCNKFSYDTVRIISPKSGDCLTIRPGEGLTELYHAKCISNPTNTSQLFRTFQVVLYNQHTGKPGIVGTPSLLPFSYSPSSYDPENGPPNPYKLGSNNKTILYEPLDQATKNSYSNLPAMISEPRSKTPSGE